MTDLFANLPRLTASAPLPITTNVTGPVAGAPMPGRGGFFKTYNVTEGASVRRIYVNTKREAWALDCLLTAGETGCTPITNPGPRWSGYVHKLRRNHRLHIETVTEAHHGEFAGHHARYVLRSVVQPASDGAAT